jgi:hypothetical protein
VRRLTPQSRGRLAASRKPPLTSNVRQSRQMPSAMRALPSFVSDNSARFSVGVGCPSFGGQRTNGGGSSRLRASLGTGLKPSLSGSCLVGLRQALSSAVLCENLYTVTVVPLVQRSGFTSSRRTPNAECQMPTVSTRQRRAHWASSQSSSAVAALRSGCPLAQPGPPNRSVKGTCLRQAPYLGR